MSPTLPATPEHEKHYVASRGLSEALAQQTYTALRAKYPGCRIVEVVLVFNAGWTFLGYQVTITVKGKTVEVFMKANGMFMPLSYLTFAMKMLVNLLKRTLGWTSVCTL